MSDSEEVESDEEFDLQLEFLDLFDPRRGKKTHAIACGNCTLSLEDVKYVECAECRATICLPVSLYFHTFIEYFSVFNWVVRWATMSGTMPIVL